MSDPTKDIVVLRIGLIFAQVCAPETATKEEIEAACNGQAPTGISSGWCVCDSPLDNGDDNPVTCANDATRRHWILNC